jgi:hypothetical protein
MYSKNAVLVENGFLVLFNAYNVGRNEELFEFNFIACVL